MRAGTRVKGVEQIVRKLTAYEKAVKKAVQKGVCEAAQLVAHATKAKAPKQTGLLKRSIGWRTVPRRDDAGYVGLAVAAEVVDHVTPHKGDQGLFWDQDNWQPLCTSCHNRKTAREDGGFGRSPDSPTPAVFVAGAPASGKSTWVRERFQPGDLLVDLDTLFAALTDRDDRFHDPSVLPFAAEARDAVLTRLARPSGVRVAWVVTAAPDPAAVEAAARRCRARMVVMPTHRVTCLSRAAADPDRAATQALWPRLIEAWFAGWSDRLPAGAVRPDAFTLP